MREGQRQFTKCRSFELRHSWGWRGGPSARTASSFCFLPRNIRLALLTLWS